MKKEPEVATAQSQEHAEHAAIVRYCEQNNKDATVVQWPEVQAAGGLDKFGTNPNFQVPAPAPKKMFQVLHAQKAAKSRKKREQNKYSITKAREAPVMQLRQWGQLEMGGQEHAHGGGIQPTQQFAAATQGGGAEAAQHHQQHQSVEGGAAEMEGLQQEAALEGNNSTASPSQSMSSSTHSDGSPRLGNRAGLCKCCEKAGTCSSRGCRTELSADEIVAGRERCDWCEGHDDGSCDCECDQCAEGAAVAAYEMVHGEGTAADVEFTAAEVEQWADLGRDSRQQAAAVEGMADTDDQQTVQRLMAWRLAERVVPGKGDCCFESICTTSIQHEGRQQDLREAVVDSMLQSGKVSREYAARMRQPGTWATDKEVQEAAELLEVEIAVAMMRPVGDEPRIQRFVPAGRAGNGRIVLIFRPGHFNATVAAAAEEELKMAAAAELAIALEEADSRCIVEPGLQMEGQSRL